MGRFLKVTVQTYKEINKSLNWLPRLLFSGSSPGLNQYSAMRIVSYYKTQDHTNGGIQTPDFLVWHPRGNPPPTPSLPVFKYPMKMK